MLRILHNVKQQNSGATAVEYAIVLVLIVPPIIFLVATIGTEIEAIFYSIAHAFSD